MSKLFPPFTKLRQRLYSITGTVNLYILNPFNLSFVFHNNFTINVLCTFNLDMNEISPVVPDSIS